MKIRRIGRGGYLIYDGITELCIDPYLSDAVEKASGKKRLDNGVELEYNKEYSIEEILCLI